MYTRILYEDGSENLLESTNLVLVRDRKWSAPRQRPPTYWKSASLLDCNDLVVFEAARPVFHEIHDLNGGEQAYRPFLAANADKIEDKHLPLRVVEIFHAGALDLLADCG